MPVSPEFREFALEQLGAIMPLTTRPMFGGVGIYAKGLFFAFIDDDVIFFKVDEQTRAAYVTAGSKPFQPAPDQPQTLQYYELPPDVLEDPEQLEQWMRDALGAAARKKPTSKSRKKK